uniref:Ubiquitin-like domain-containing protein n=1 Tax=Steinernema glaseri TaxID=37863 RepID=A0A1I7Y401_9BILA
MNTLFEKCVAANKEVQVRIKVDDASISADSMALANFDEYYEKKEVPEPEEALLFANREQEKLALRVRSCGHSIQWQWVNANQ